MKLVIYAIPENEPPLRIIEVPVDELIHGELDIPMIFKDDVKLTITIEENADANLPDNQ